MRAAIFNPYWDTLGGGERYTATVAKILADHGYTVDVEWKDQDIKEKIESRFGLDLSTINIVDDIRRGHGYDVCFWVSDGSIPTLGARKNFLHFQFPFKNVHGKSLLNRMKLFRINKIVCNSTFTKEFIDQEYGVNSLVLYPPVNVADIKPKPKENLIVYVGRFSQLTQAKRQDILISAFKKFFDGGAKDWKLVLAGGAEVGAGDYLEELKSTAQTYPIKIITSPSLKEIYDYYGRAKVFWSASGFGVDEIKNPLGVEHFGMTVVEAMAAGCAPLIYKAGGHREIINNGENGYLWETTQELIAKTHNLVQDTKLLREISSRAKQDSLKFSYEHFEKEFLALL